MSLKKWWSRQVQLTDAQAARWERTRDRGRRRFVIVHGVLLFACVGVLTSVVTHLLGEPGPLWGRIALGLALSPPFGIWFGQRMWTHHERRYAQWRRRSSADTHHHGEAGIAQ